MQNAIFWTRQTAILGPYFFENATMKEVNFTYLHGRALWQSAKLPAAWLATLLAIAACGGGSAGYETTPPLPPPSPTALHASTPGALLGYVQGKLLEQVDKGLYFSGYGSLPIGGEGVSIAASTSIDNSVKSFSSTTLQETSVDEADVMKTDGQRIFSLTGIQGGWLRELRVDRRLADGGLAADGTLALSESDLITGFYLATSGERVAVLRRQMFLNISLGLSDLNQPYHFIDTPKTLIDLIDARTGRALVKSHRIRVDGDLVGSRMIGDTLYLVTTWYPRLDVVPPFGSSTAAERKAGIGQLKNKDLLPTVSVTREGSTEPFVSEPLLADTDCYLQAKNASYGVQLTTITAFNLASPTLERASRCFLGDTEALYMSAQNVYLTTSRYEVFNERGVLAYPSQVSTDIHKFALNGLAIQYRGSGEVSGHLGWDDSKTPYRMSEYQGDLRVLSYTNQFGWFGEQGAANSTTKPSPAILSVLREDPVAGTLKTLSTLPNSKRPGPIGLSGEQVYAVRFLGDRGYVVTFRRTDPLYILDLSDAVDPKVVGELKTNGYSDYLLPAGPGLLVGVGKDATAEGRVQGVKVSLFDVANARAPKELATRVFGKAGSFSGLDDDRHGVNLMTVGGTTRLALPVQVNETPSPTFEGFYCPTYQGLLRFDIDATARTLTDQPTIIGKRYGKCSPDEYQNMNPIVRSVQIGDYVYYLTGQGQVLSAPW